MALRKCKECKAEVSSQAAACPFCGAPVKREPIGCIGGVVIIGALLFAINYFSKDDPPPQRAASQPTPAASKPADQRQWVVLRTTSNVRQGAGTDHPVVKTLAEGTRYRCHVPSPDADWVKCGEGEYIHKSLVDFNASRSAPAASSTGNPAHDQLMRATDSDRNRALAAVVQASDESCREVTRNFHQGFYDEDRSSFWNVTCSNGASYVVTVVADAEGSTRVMSCSVLKMVADVDCFTRLK